MKIIYANLQKRKKNTFIDERDRESERKREWLV
jgi:hypothetical protein